MTATLIPLTSLFLSVFVLMLGHGLIGILVPTRLGLEGISANSIGIITSMFAVGLLLGGIYTRKLIVRVGHVRVFAASAALAAMSILLCSLWVNEWLWGAMRIVMGFCIASVNTVSDGWLSERSTSETRGRILAINQIVVMVAIFLGSFVVNLADMQSATLYIIAGLMLCAGVVPIVMGRVIAPEPEDIPSMPIKQLLATSPVGVIGVIICGVLFSSVWGLIPVYGKDIGLEGFDISLLVGSVIMGSFALQFPIGYLSDRFDRRTVMLNAVIAAGVMCFLVPLTMVAGWFWGALALIALSSGIAACLYPLGVSEAFDRLRTAEMGAAMGTMVMIYAIGGTAGPFIAGFVMELFGTASLFIFLAIANLSFAGFIMYRMSVRKAVPIDQQESFVMQGAATGWMSTELDPRTEYTDTITSVSPEVEVAVGLAESKPELAVKMTSLVAKASPEQLIEVVRAVAAVKGVDAMKLYYHIIESAPDQQQEIAQAIAAVAPEQAAELITHVLEETKPEEVADIAIAMTEVAPEQSTEIIQAAAEYVVEEDSPEVVAEIAEAYASNVSDQWEDMRYADRLADESEQAVAEVVANLAEVAPEQAIDMAATVVEALPDAASEVVEALKDSDAVEGKIMSDIDDRPEVSN